MAPLAKFLVTCTFLLFKKLKKGKKKSVPWETFQWFVLYSQWWSISPMVSLMMMFWRIYSVSPGVLDIQCITRWTGNIPSWLPSLADPIRASVELRSAEMTKSTPLERTCQGPQKERKDCCSTFYDLSWAPLSQALTELPGCSKAEECVISKVLANQVSK